MSEADNLRRWPSDRRGVYEVWYTTWNDPATGHGFWLRYIIESPHPGKPVPPYGDEPRGELWFARFDPTQPARTFGIHKRFPLASVSTSDAPFQVSIAGCTQGNDYSVGALAGGGHDVTWDLRWEPSPTTMRWYPDALYLGGGVAESTALSPNPRVSLSGQLVIDGETYKLDRALAGQSHVWGKKHAYSWLWAHCNDFAGAADTTLELIGARLVRGRIALPTIATISLVLDGETLSLNQLRNIPRNYARWHTSFAHVRGSSLTTRIVAELSCQPSDMVNAPYVDPDGQDLFCANTCIGNATLTVWKRSGFKWLEHRRLEAKGRAHFEIGRRERDPMIETPHVLVVE